MAYQLALPEDRKLFRIMMEICVDHCDSQGNNATLVSYYSYCDSYAKLIIYLLKNSAQDQARATLRLADGSVHVEEIEHAVGSQLNPMTDVQLEEKFTSLCNRILSPAGTTQLWQHCWHIAELADAAALPTAASLQPV